MPGFAGSGYGYGSGPAVAFPAAPYIEGIDGYVRVQGLTPPAPGATSHEGRQVLGDGSAIRLWGEGGVNGLDFWRSTGGFLWSGAHGLELGGELRYYRENLGDGTTDRLWIGSLAVTYQALMLPGAQLRSGIGMRWMPDADLLHTGVYGTLGLDLYPVRPLILSLSGDLGVLGEALTVNARATAGIIIGRVEVYGGYDMFRIDDNDLDTWTAGIRLWN